MFTVKKKVDISDGLIFALGQGLDFYSPVIWSCTRCHLAYHGFPTLVPLLRQSSQKADVLSPDHWQDVLAGSILGLVMANFAYRQYFHSLASKISHLPYEPRTQRPEDVPDHHALGLPRYQTLRRPMDREVDDGEVELIRDAVRSGQLEQGWDRAPSMEGGLTHN